MIELIGLLGIVLILAALIFIGKYIYYYFYPNETLANIISSNDLLTIINSEGKAGKNGNDGVSGEFAINGMDGKLGQKGDIGIHGRHSLVTGQKGASGSNGLNGLSGIGGISGTKGLPSNSMLSYIYYVFDHTDNIKPLTLENYFSYENVLHKISTSFIFDNLNSFSFKNSPSGERLKIDTSDPEYVNIGTGGKVRSIFSNLRVILEKRTQGTRGDGIVFYASAPISRVSYLFVSDPDSDFIEDNKTLFRFEELEIGLNREFGLDFSTVSTSNVFRNYLLNGLARYRVIFNIDPPIQDVKPRIEEIYSKSVINETLIPALDMRNKGNLLKIKNDDSIYLLSPPLESGKVVLKDFSNPSSIWTVQKFQSLIDSVEDYYPGILESYDFLEKDMLTLKPESNKAKNRLIARKFDKTGLSSNFIVRLKSSPPLLITGGVIPIFGNKLFTTKAIINNFIITHSNTDSPISYPSRLQGSTLFMKFVLKIRAVDIENKKYFVYLTPLPSDPTVILETNSFVMAPIPLEVDPDEKYPQEDGCFYHLVTIQKESSLDFSDFFGRRIFLRLSLASLDFELRNGFVSEYDFDNIVRFTAHPIDEHDFQTPSSTYDFLLPSDPQNIEGLSVTFSCNKFSVANDTFYVGYSSSGTDHYERVKGFRISNGDYMIDIPSYGYGY